MFFSIQNDEVFPDFPPMEFGIGTIPFSFIWRMVVVIIEILLFSGFIWALAGWFTSAYEVKRWEYRFIKISGIVFVIAHLACAVLYPLPSLTISFAGVALLLLSALLFAWTFSEHETPPSVAFSDKITSELKLTGPYRFIRHPFYTSYLIAWLGGTLATGCWWLIISFLCMGFIYYRAASEEERQWLNSTHAGVYASYMKNTGRFIIHPFSIFRNITKH